MVAFLEKSTGSAGFHQIIDFLNRSHICYALTKKPDVCVSFIKQFWRSAEVSTAENGEVKITATIDGHSLTITEGSLRRHLKLDDQDGLSSIPNSSREYFERIAPYGISHRPDKITSSPSPSPEPSHSPEHSPTAPTQPSPTQPSPTQPSPTQPSPTHQSPGAEHHFPTPYDSPIYVVHSHRSDEGSLQLNELRSSTKTFLTGIRAFGGDLKRERTLQFRGIYQTISQGQEARAQIKTGESQGKKFRFVILWLFLSNEAPFLKEKKGVRFSALYLQKKRNLLVFDHSHQQVSYFSMLVQSLSGSTYISCDSNVEYLRANLNIKDMSNSRRTSLLNIDYMLYPSLLRTVTDWKGKPSLRSTERSLLHDNIVPKPDLALELGKSISLTEAEEEAVAREVHATHARIVSGPDPEPMQEDQTGSNSGKLHVSLAGPNPEHMDDEFLATAYPKVHENLKLITDERVIEENPESHSGSMSSMKNLDDTYNFGDQFLYDKPTEDDQEKSKVIEESDSTIPDPSHQTVTSTPPVIAPFTDVSSTKPSSLVTPPPINTEATTITTSLPEITPFIALQLRVARLEQEMSEVKKTDHSADVLASIKSQVPTVVDEYLGTKLDDALLKILERHTADLIEKYSVAWPRVVQDHVYEKSPASSVHMKRRSLQQNSNNYRHIMLLMVALIGMKTHGIRSAEKVKDHKRKHDSNDDEDDDDEDDDDDEGPSAGSNQGRSTKRRRSDSAASGSAQPPPKDDD
ncbi:hypothetical protein Tco_1203192 [Tanacetum coccineum]